MKIVSVLNDGYYRRIPLKGWNSVVTAVNTFGDGGTSSSRATTNNQIKAMGESYGGMGVALFLLGSMDAKSGGDIFVDRLLAEAKEALKSRDSWNRHYDYDGQGVFFKTSVEIGFLDRDEEMYYLSIHAAYVGDKPEEGLAETLGIPRALTSTAIVIQVEPSSETTFVFDFSEILRRLQGTIDTGLWTGPGIVQSMEALSREKHGGTSTIELYREGDIEVVLSTGRVEGRYKWDNGEGTDTWIFDGSVLSGLLDESFEEGKDYDEPTILISIRRKSNESYNRKPFYLPEEKEAVLALSQRIADALAPC